MPQLVSVLIDRQHTQYSGLQVKVTVLIVKTTSPPPPHELVTHQYLQVVPQVKNGERKAIHFDPEVSIISKGR